MRISDWSSDVGSSDLTSPVLTPDHEDGECGSTERPGDEDPRHRDRCRLDLLEGEAGVLEARLLLIHLLEQVRRTQHRDAGQQRADGDSAGADPGGQAGAEHVGGSGDGGGDMLSPLLLPLLLSRLVLLRSEEHTSELQSLMRISYAV